VVDASQPFIPVEVVCDPACHYLYESSLPRRLVVETTAGVEMAVPLLLWGGVESRGERYYVGNSAETRVVLRGHLFFGDGDSMGADVSPIGPARVPVTAPHTNVRFRPQEVAGREVGHDAEGFRFAVTDSAGTWWHKTNFEIILLRGAGAEVPEPPSVLPPPRVRVERDYFPPDLEFFAVFGIVPPDAESVIELQ
jgi:hypothetical protein